MSLSNILRTMNKKNLSYSLMAVVCTSVMTLCSCSKDKDIAPVVDPYNGREYVDLGLSVKWATYNIGATKPEEYGNYFAWGETTPKSVFSWDNYKFTADGGKTLTKYTGTDKSILGREDDAAAALWGGEWRMPTADEVNELFNNTTGEWIKEGNPEFAGVAGVKFTSNKPGYTDKYVFLPAAGCRFESELYGAGAVCYYWTSSLYDVDAHRAHRCVVRDTPEDPVRTDGRPGGHAIRPVCPAGKGSDEEGGSTPEKDKDVPTSHNGYECIDLGIRIDGKKLLFATCNVGASKPEEYGDYFAWGATAPYYTGYTMNGTSVTVTSWKEGLSDGYSQANTPFYSSGSGSDAIYTTYTAAGDVLSLEHDAAHATMGGDWRMPTTEEMRALYDNTTSSWTIDYNGTGISGHIFKGKGDYADRTLFLPCAGLFTGVTHSNNTNGYYWSSTLQNMSNGYNMVFTHGSGVSIQSYEPRYFGFSVRAVFTISK